MSSGRVWLNEPRKDLARPVRAVATTTASRILRMGFSSSGNGRNVLGLARHSQAKQPCPRVANAPRSRYRHRVTRRFALLLACLLLLAPGAEAALDGRRLRFSDGRLRDQAGREVTLRGV